MPEVVISNTSPLQYLYQVGQFALLPRLYQQVTIPPAVVQELADGAALGVALPVLPEVAWLQVQAPSATQVWRVASTLGAGEREALALVLETPNALLLLDDGHARRFGRLLGLRMTGTVGVLACATREGLVPRLAPLLVHLDVLGFRLSAQARAMALTLVGEHP
jgi:predicted nucleic acid-binding protein